MHLLDGNKFPIQFRFHNNAFPNSPVSQRVGSGYLLSNNLHIGEPAFDPTNMVLSVGVGQPQGLSAVSADRNSSDLRFDATPISGTDGCIVYKDRVINSQGQLVMRLTFNSVRFGPAITYRDDSSGTDQITFGYNHWNVAMALLFNIQNVLAKAVANTMAEADIDSLYTLSSQYANTSALRPEYPEQYGEKYYHSNLITYSEDYTQTFAEQNITVTDNTGEAPDNNVTLDTLVGSINTATANTCYADKSATVFNNSLYTGSVVVKEGTSPVSTFSMFFSGGTHAAEQGYVTINWTTLTTTVTLPTGDTYWQGGMTPMNNGCYRLWLTGYSYDNTSVVIRQYVRDQGTTHVTGETTQVGWAMVNAGPNLARYNMTTATL